MNDWRSGAPPGGSRAEISARSSLFMKRGNDFSPFGAILIYEWKRETRQRGRRRRFKGGPSIGHGYRLNVHICPAASAAKEEDRVGGITAHYPENGNRAYVYNEEEGGLHGLYLRRKKLKRSFSFLVQSIWGNIRDTHLKIKRLAFPYSIFLFSSGTGFYDSVQDN